MLVLGAATFAFFRGEDEAASATRLRVLLFMRLARLLRLLYNVRLVRTALITVAEISPLLWRIVVVLFITMYCLAVVGYEAFAGILRPSNPHVAASSYGVNGQEALNFDSFAQALMVQFAVLVTTQIPVVVEGLMAGTGSWWPLVYMGAVYALLVCVVSNILIALLLQSYGTSHARAQYRQAGYVEIWEHLVARAQRDLHAMEAAAAASSAVGTPGTPPGTFDGPGEGRFPRPLVYKLKRRCVGGVRARRWLP